MSPKHLKEKILLIHVLECQQHLLYYLTCSLWIVYHLYNELEKSNIFNEENTRIDNFKC